MQEGVENREQNQRDGERFQQPDHEHAELAEIFVAPAGEDRLGLEDDSHGNPGRDADQDADVERRARSSPRERRRLTVWWQVGFGHRLGAQPTPRKRVRATDFVWSRDFGSERVEGE